MNDIVMQFEQVKLDHKKTILGWFDEEHVKAFFYGEGLKNTLSNLDLFCDGINDNGSYTFYDWIAFCNGEPFAFLITSPIVGPYNETEDYNKWYRAGKKTLTLDVLIGNKNYLGKGLAHNLIQRFILDKYSDADYFIIDPESSNSKAIHVYEKIGFRKVDEFIPAFNPKSHTMLRISIDTLKNKDGEA